MDGSTHQLSHARLVALIVQLRSEVAELRTACQRLTAESEALKAENPQRKQRISELKKWNLTQRLQQSNSMNAEEKRRQDAASDGKTKHGSSGDRQQSETGESLFFRLLRENGLDPPTESRLDTLVPVPDPA